MTAGATPHTAFLNVASPGHAIAWPTGEAGALVFASPHSGTDRPTDFGPDPSVSEAQLTSAEDALVDRLIAPGTLFGVPVLRGLISRTYVDLNRDPGELDPMLIADCPPGSVTAKTAAGFGVVPRRNGEGGDIYDRTLSLAEVHQRIDRVHKPYHKALAELMQATHRRHGRAILIDWHSMPSRAAGQQGRDRPGVHVVLGTRHGAACAVGLTRRLEALFEAQGWRVALNTPYAGGYSTQIWGRPSEGYHAIQIELNRALYLDETSRLASDGRPHCEAALKRVIAGLCADPGLD